MRDNSMSYNIFKTFNYLLMGIVVIICVFPFLHVAAKSLNNPLDTAIGGLTIFPRDFTFQNYFVVFANPFIFNAFFVTISRVLLAIPLGVFVQFLAAFALSRKYFYGKNFITYYLMIPMFFSAGIVPTFILYLKMHLINNFLVYVLPGAFAYFSTIIIKTYIQSTISPSLEESAKIDGANEFTVLFRIIFPLSLPILATIALYGTVAHWNDWTTTLYYISPNKKHLFTLQYQLMRIIKESEAQQQAQTLAIQLGGGSNLEGAKKVIPTPESITCAQTMVVTLPILCIYPFLQRYFVSGLMIGGVKE